MKFSRTRSWPHPVVSPLSDDVSPNNFDFQLDVWPEHQRWLLGVDSSDDDPHLAAHVRAGKASYVLHVECKKTYFRASFRSASPRFEVQVSGDHLFGLVEVSLLLVATADLESYRHPRQHEDYRDGTFAVGIGQPIAVAQSKTFDAFLEADPILKLSSIINIRKGEGDQRIISVNCEGDRIRIDLPPDQFLQYRNMRADPAIRGLLASTIILPALMDAFYYLRNPDLDIDDFKADHRWCRCVLGRLERLGFDIADPNSDNSMCLKAAQLLLREPLRRSLEDLSGLFSTPRL